MKSLIFIKNIVIIILALGLTVAIAGILKDRIKEDNLKTEEIILSPINIENKFTSLNGIDLFINNPSLEKVVESPLVLEGRAPGNWFFEASAPVVVTNWNGLIIGEGFITAEGDWMTTDYVSFSGSINFTNTEYGDYGFVILKKDNPSGESQFDDSIEFKVLLK